MTAVTNPFTGAEVEDLTNLTDEESRQTRYPKGDALMRLVDDTALNIPARVIKDGRIFLAEGRVRNADGTVRWFENQDSNLIELTTQASYRFEEAVEEAEDAALDLDKFEFRVSLADLQTRRAAFIHGRWASPRESRFADSPYWTKPIIGLDIDGEGEALDIDALRKDLRRNTRAAATQGMTAATGGAFED